MASTVFKKIFGSRNQRLLRKLSHSVDKINKLEPELQALSDDALKAKTSAFRERLLAGETLDSLLPEAFAVVREASVRTLGLRHFDVQLIGGAVLHQGKIAEMCTGEGKTLASTLAAYLNALTGEGVHIVTVNDYLAKRDAEWMGPIYAFLGLSVGVIQPDMPHPDKQAAYLADITYGTNNEFGFDYLRDNMAFSMDHKMQRPLHYAIIDEVDSILIDEARTPLIISGPVNEDADLYVKINTLIPLLTRSTKDENSGTDTSDGDGGEDAGHYTLDEKTKQAFLTEEGHHFIEQQLTQVGLLTAGESLYDVRNIALMHHINAAMRAHFLFKRDVDYIVKNDEIIIVDEHTGRTMEGRRWSDGLHQAVEAKEKVPVKNENQTLASITFQNYFRLYKKLAGMTGTADTEAFEFQQIYGLEVVVIPTNKPLIRQDLPDQIYLTQREKYKAVITAIKAAHEAGRPILVGTASIETSEVVSNLLNGAKIPHQVLNAKFHEKEASIIAQAGNVGAVTIATNMAGRGTDIVLGGNVEAELAALGDKAADDAKVDSVKKAWKERHAAVLAAGGLLVLGTERNESRRIDNQLRGRSGRQGDPGASQFYLSLDDNLMRIFASERVSNLMKKLGLEEDEVIAHPLVNRAIENAQRKLEGYNFDVRKQLLKYDDVANDQRKIIYSQRDSLLASDSIADMIAELRQDVIFALTAQLVPEGSFAEQWDIPTLQQLLENDFGLHLPIQQWLEDDKDGSLQTAGLADRIAAEVTAAYKEKEQEFGLEIMRQVEKSIMLESLDNHWKEHIAAMDHLRQGIHLRSYAQKDPAQEFKRESFNMFSHLLDTVHYDVISKLSLVRIQTADDIEAVEAQRQKLAESTALQYDHSAVNNLSGSTQEQGQGQGQKQAAHLPETTPSPARAAPKVGRNEPCPCGSGKKYKHCHGG